MKALKDNSKEELIDIIYKHRIHIQKMNDKIKTIKGFSDEYKELKWYSLFGFIRRIIQYIKQCK